MLTTEAFNALLKTLEEPPPHVIFIFATTEPHKIPATILSRCQRFDFRRLSLMQIVEHLKKIISQEGADFSEGILYAIAREADGSMRDAQSLLEQLLAFSGDELPETQVLDILGVIDRQSVLRTAEAILSENAPACLEIVADVYRRGIDSRRFCQHLCDHFRNLLFAAISAEPEMLVDLPEDEKKLLKDQAAVTTPESLHVYFQMLLRGEEQIRRSSMPKIALEMLLLRMARLPRLESIDAVLDRIAMIEQSLKEGHSASACIVSESRPGFEKRASSPPPGGFTAHLGPARLSSDSTDDCEPVTTPDPELPGQADFPLAALREPELAQPVSAVKAVEGWPAFVAFLENRNPVLWAKVSHCAVKASGEMVELEVPDMFEKGADGPEFIHILEDASQAFFGARLQWMVTIKKTSETSRGAAAKGPKTGKPSSAKHVVNHPAVQQAIEILGAELIEVKPSRGLDPGGKKKNMDLPSYRVRI
jgi:DNA polymerase-3 subunit gamma/tau